MVRSRMRLIFGLSLAISLSFSLFCPVQADYKRVLGYAGAAAAVASLPFVYGLLQKAHMPEVGLERLHCVTMQPAKPAQVADLPALSMKTVLGSIRAGRPFDGLYNAGTDKNIAIKSGVPSGVTDTVFIYSSGLKCGPCDSWARYIAGFRGNGVGTLIAHKYLALGIINGPLVAFDYPTDFAESFNIGQELDVRYLYQVYCHVVEHNPQARIVLVGDCKGGTAIVRLITHPELGRALQHLEGVIIQSPPLSLQTIISTLATDYALFFPKVAFKILHAMTKAWFPAYREHGDCRVLFDIPADHVPKQLPIYIGSITQDHIAAHGMTQYLIGQLQKSGNEHVYLFTTDESIRHAHITKSANYINGIHAFLQRYHFAHNQEKASYGVSVLEDARKHALQAIESH